MLDLFSYQFVYMALIVAFLVSICSGILGSIIVANKSVFVAGGVAHCAFGGVGVAIFFGFSTMLGALGFSVLMALFIAYANFYQKDRLDSYIGAAWAFGMALGVIMIDISPGYASDISSFLFGSLIAVNFTDIAALLVFDVILISFVGLYYNEIVSLFFDSEFCRLKGLNVSLWLVVIYIIISIGVVLSMSVAGLILVLAILSIPAYMANLFVKSLKMMMIVGFFISLVFSYIGFFVAFVSDISVGACIVIMLSVGMLISMIAKNVILNKRGKNE